MAKAAKKVLKIKSLKPEIEELKKSNEVVVPDFPTPRKEYTTRGVIFNWLLFIAIVSAIYFGIRCINFSFPTLKGWQAVLFGFSAAFVWVNRLGWLHHTKPFNCLPCMSGWATLILAFMFHVEAWYMYVFVGVVVGSIFNGIKMRWL